MYEKLTSLLDVIRPEDSGEWIIDREHKGTPEDPKQMPFVDYSGPVTEPIHAVHETVEAHPELELTQYYDVLERKGFPLDGTHRPENADVEHWDLQGTLALLVAIVRMDRFSEGLLKAQIEAGTVQRCLERVKELDG